MFVLLFWLADVVIATTFHLKRWGFHPIAHRYQGLHHKPRVFIFGPNKESHFIRTRLSNPGGLIKSEQCGQVILDKLPFSLSVFSRQNRSWLNTLRHSRFAAILASRCVTCFPAPFADTAVSAAAFHSVAWMQVLLQPIQTAVGTSVRREGMAQCHVPLRP